MFTKIKNTIVALFPVAGFASEICTDRDAGAGICAANETDAFSYLQSPVNFEQCAGINHIMNYKKHHLFEVVTRF